MEKPLELAIIGAGFAGLHMLHRAVGSQRNVRLFEAGSSVGGTWHWNRYPGARVDVESMAYCYAFSKELEQDWNWTERYSPQPELLRYANHVADRFGLRAHIQLDTRIVSAVFDEDRHLWTLTTAHGERIVARHCVLATGLLHAPKRLPIPGLDTFGGVQAYTSRWPQGTELAGKQVVVIGTGSSGIQTISEVAKVASQLTVLQRTPSYVIPARNHALDARYLQTMKARYEELRARQFESMGGFFPLAFLDDPHPKFNALEVSDEQRKAVYDANWAAGGLSFYTAFKDLLLDPAANETCAEYVRGKIREAVHDPATADKLTPRYPILARRLCAGTGYYEVYNQTNVELVDVNDAPIERAVPEGLIVGGRLVPCDVIIFATGFDALTGAIEKIDIRGRAGRSIKAHWAEGVSTYAGMMCAGFPNLIMMNGPSSPSAFWAPIQIAEYQADWIERCLDHLARARLDCIEARPECEAQWMQTVEQLAAPTMFARVKSWYFGDNIPDKKHRMLVYLGGYAAYCAECEHGAANGYQNFDLSRFDATAAVHA